jgi:hypothetical protein
VCYRVSAALKALGKIIVGSLATIATVVEVAVLDQAHAKGEKPLKTIMPAKNIFSKKVSRRDRDGGYRDDDDGRLRVCTVTVSPTK